MAHSLGVIDPTVLDRLSNLEFVARKAVEGFMAGHHRTPHRGSSVDFAQHRPYAAGDELRKIDWKVFARSDRLVVKEYVEETNLSLNLLLDASESMGYGSLDWNKLDYARWCAASLAHLVLGQRDTVGLVVFDEDWRAKVPPGNGARQEVAVFGVLADAQPIGKTSVGGALNRLGPRLKQRGITAIFSDFFEDLDTIMDGIKRLLHEGHEPILFQILDPEELEFNFDHLVKLEGLEDAGKRKIDPRAIREAYIEEITRHNRELARATAALNVDCILARTDEPLDAVISTYLTHRAARARGGGQRT